MTVTVPEKDKSVWMRPNNADNILQITDVLTDIFSFSLIQAAVPSSLKSAAVIPVLNKFFVTCLNTYHSISLT